MALVGRALLAGLMLAGTAQKIADPSEAQALLELAGWPLWLIWPSAVFTAIAGLGLLLGVGTRPLALAAAAYCIVTSYFHLLLGDPWQITIAAKNWTIAGGYLVLAVHGPGKWALRP